MKTRILSNNETQAEITLTLPGEVLCDLEKIASLNKTRTGDLVYSYIVDGLASDVVDGLASDVVDGLASDALAVNRTGFADKTKRTPVASNGSMKAVEDLLKNLMY